MSSQPTFPTDNLRIETWTDPVVDRLGHDPRSTYVETYWLGILGPSACWLLRRLADGLDAEPGGYALDMVDTAASIGLRLNGGRHAPFMRTLGRICQFRMARLVGVATLEVCRNLPPLTLAQADRLTAPLRDAHRQETDTTRADHRADQARRARHLALTLVQLGEDRSATERQLREWRFNATLCNEVADWAWEARRKLTRARQPATARPAPTTGPVPVPASTSTPDNPSAGEPSRSRPTLDGAA
ncbi:MAG: hypothetical protein V1249_12460 [Acidimicrobiales bacterium]|nr:hypothetical protein [Acidimicrobiales bacterium]